MFQHHTSMICCLLIHFYASLWSGWLKSISSLEQSVRELVLIFWRGWMIFGNVRLWNTTLESLDNDIFTNVEAFCLHFIVEFWIFSYFMTSKLPTFLSTGWTKQSCILVKASRRSSMKNLAMACKLAFRMSMRFRCFLFSVAVWLFLRNQPRSKFYQLCHQKKFYQLLLTYYLCNGYGTLIGKLL